MNKIRRFYNQNSKKITKTIVIIVFVIIIIQLLNKIITLTHNDKSLIDGLDNNSINDFNKEGNGEIISDKSLVTGDQIGKKKLESDSNIIKEFINNCNDNNLEESYKLISDNCKKELYPTLEEFKNTYYKNVFGGEKKLYTIENWIGDIYRINISNNILSTGNVNKEINIMDYISVEEDKNERKLNINGYIGKKDINKEVSYMRDKFKVKVISEEKYIDYTIYDIEIVNELEKDILLDNLDDINSMYIMDSNKVKYYAYTNEYYKEQFLAKREITTNVKVKYYSKYGSTKKIEKLVFSKVDLNYKNNQNPNNYFKIEIDV